MKEHRLVALWILRSAVLVLCVTGCTTHHTVKVDSLAQPTAENSIAYRITANDPAVDPESLRHKEAERFVKTALSGKGLYEAPNAELADIVVNLDYGISPPKVTQETRRVRRYRTVPGAIRSYRIVTGYTQSGSPIFDTVTYQEPPRQEYVGDDEYTVTFITYEKHLRLSARANTPPAEGQPPAEVWTVNVITEGESRDLRKALPILAAASIEYVGKDSRGEQTIRLKDTDEAVSFVKKGL